MSLITDFLINDYLTYHGLTWDSSTMFLRVETPKKNRFEIEDKKKYIVQAPGQGVAKFRQGVSDVEVLDLEDFMKTVHHISGFLPSTCDFILSPQIGTDYIVLNELTHTASIYIHPFKQPTTGEFQEGKLEKAHRQLLTTIERLYEVNNICDLYSEKVALFSCRLSDKHKNGVMAKSAKAFSSPIYRLQKLKLQEKLPHGFTFKMRIYDSFFPLS